MVFFTYQTYKKFRQICVMYQINHIRWGDQADLQKYRQKRSC